MWAERMLTVQVRYILNFVLQAFQVFKYHEISEAWAHTCNCMFVLKYDVRYTTLGWRHNCHFPDFHIPPDVSASVLCKSNEHSYC